MQSVVACLLVVLAAASSSYVYPYGAGYYGGYYGGYPAAGYYGHHGYGFYGQHGAVVDPYNHEFDYRQFGKYPVHLGAGRFAFLGLYHGTCAHGHSNAFYYTDTKNSFVVCNHGRAHHFKCAEGTENKDRSHFVENHYYGMGEVCGVNLNDNNAA